MAASPHVGNLSGKPDNAAGSRLILQWTRATFFGWALGFVLMLILLALSGAVGLGETQFPVGLGMGAGVGLMQARLVKAILGKGRPWLVGSALGIAGPFIINDALHLFPIEVYYSLPILVVIGGLVTGVTQWPMLRERLPRASWWIIASTIGWGSAASSVLVNERFLPKIPGIKGALLHIAVILLGGVILGAIGGYAIYRIAGQGRPA